MIYLYFVSFITTGEGYMYTILIPKRRYYNTRFGRCTCGVPKRDGVPCIHMAVLVLGGDLPDPTVTQVTIMPYWLTTEHWREQYPQDITSKGSLTIKSIMASYQPDDRIRYGPEWAAPQKAGRPKANARVMGVADYIQASAKKRKRRKKLFCTICNKFNHNTEDCFLNTKRTGNDEHQGDTATPTKMTGNYEAGNDDEDDEV